MVDFGDPEVRKQEARRRKREKAWARHLGTGWDAFVTLTRPEADPAYGRVLADAGKWVERLEARRPGRPYVLVVERRPYAHVHGLLGGVGTRYLRPLVDELWPSGNTHLIRAPGRDRVAYMATKMDDNEVLVPDNLATRARRARRFRSGAAR